MIFLTVSYIFLRRGLNVNYYLRPRGAPRARLAIGLLSAWAGFLLPTSRSVEAIVDVGVYVRGRVELLLLPQLACPNLCGAPE